MNLIILIAIIIIIFYIINNIILKQNIQENYLTYFLPYYSDEQNDLYNFYKNDINDSFFFKRKMDYVPLKVAGSTYHKYFLDIFLKTYLEKSNLLKIENMNYDDEILSLKNLNKGDIDIALTDYNKLLYIKNTLKEDISNIRIITHLYKLYYYFFVKKESNINSIDNIPPNFKLGVLKYPNEMAIYHKNLLLNFGYEDEIYYKTYYYNTTEELFDNLNNLKLDVIIIHDVFPNITLKNLIDKYYQKDIILLPFDINNEKVFFQKNKILNKGSFDLNDLAESYLPKSFGKYTYNFYKPDIPMLYCYKILVTNYNTNYEWIYNLLDFYHNNYKTLNNYFKNRGYQLYNINNDDVNIVLRHYAVIKYMFDKGFNTYENNDNCKYLVGVDKCTKETLQNNNFMN